MAVNEISVLLFGCMKNFGQRLLGACIHWRIGEWGCSILDFRLGDNYWVYPTLCLETTDDLYIG